MIELILSLIFIFLLFGLIIIYYCKNKVITAQSAWLIFFVCVFSPFFLNFILNFDNFYDLRLYLYNIKSIRSLDFSLLHDSIPVYFFSWVISALPFPTVIEAITLQFFIKFLFLVFILYLLKKKIILDKSFIFYFLLFSPSILVYSSLLLRDILNFIIVFFILYNLSNRKYLKFLLFNLILLFLKKELSLIFFFIGFLYFIIFEIKKKKIFIVSGLFLLFFFNYKSVLEIINFHRFNLYFESVDGNQDLLNNYKPLKINLDIFYQVFYSNINFILSPLMNLFDNFNINKLIIFFEIIFIYAYLGYLFFKKKLTFKKIFFIISLFLVFFIYALVTFNDGTISRWRISFILPYVVLINYLTNTLRGKKKTIKK